MYTVRVEQMDSRPLAVVKRLARQQDLGKVVPECCGLVWGVVKSQNIAGAGRHVAIYHDGAINLEVGVELEAPFGGYGEVVDSATPAGLAAWTTHLGPYGQLHGAHQAIQDYCANNGYVPAGPQWEIYGHWEDAWNNDPSLIRTDVYYLVERK